MALGPSGVSSVGPSVGTTANSSKKVPLRSLKLTDGTKFAPTHFSPGMSTTGSSTRSANFATGAANLVSLLPSLLSGDISKTSSLTASVVTTVMDTGGLPNKVVHAPGMVVTVDGNIRTTVVATTGGTAFLTVTVSLIIPNKKKRILEETKLGFANHSTGSRPTMEGVTFHVVLDLARATFLRPAGLVAVGVSILSPNAIRFVFYGGTPIPTARDYLSSHTAVSTVGLAAGVSTSGSSKKDCKELAQ